MLIDVPILKEISFIHIEPPNYVTEVHGPDIATGSEIRLRVEEEQNSAYYIRDSSTNKDVPIIKITIDPNNKVCFFAEDETTPQGNLLERLGNQT